MTNLEIEDKSKTVWKVNNKMDKNVPNTFIGKKVIKKFK